MGRRVNCPVNYFSFIIVVPHSDLVFGGSYVSQNLDTSALHAGDTITVSFWLLGYLTAGLGTTSSYINSTRRWSQQSISYQLTANDLSSVTLGFSEMQDGRC